jgi:hypothetical protein
MSTLLLDTPDGLTSACVTAKTDQWRAAYHYHTKYSEMLSEGKAVKLRCSLH